LREGDGGLQQADYEILRNRSLRVRDLPSRYRKRGEKMPNQDSAEKPRKSEASKKGGGVRGGVRWRRNGGGRRKRSREVTDGKE